MTDIGWYGSAYLLTNCSFQLLYGKIYTFFSIKAVFLSAVFLFEVGSAICGAAPSSTSFIIGRAIAGLGSSGIMSGAVCLPPLPSPPFFVYTIYRAKRRPPPLFHAKSQQKKLT